MPPYLQSNGNETPSESIYPGQSGIPVGYKAVPGGPASLASDQAEAIVTGFKSKAICVAAGMGAHGFTQRQINWRVNYGIAPSAIAWVLQGSVDDVDGDYIQVDTSSTITNFTQTVPSNLKFFRLYASSVTGPCTAVVKLSCM